MQNSSYLVYAAIAIVLWSSLAAIAAGMTHVPPFLLIALPFILGGCLSIPLRRHWQFDIKILAFGIAGIFGYHLFLFSALRLAPAVEANLINYTWPLLVVLFSPLFLPKLKLTLQHILSALIGFSGVYLLVAGPSAIQFSQEAMLGYGLAFGASITWACYSLISTRLSGVHSATIGLFCLLSGIFSLVVSALFETWPTLTTSDLGTMVLLGLGPMGLSFYAWDKALKLGDPRTIGVLSYSTPMLSTLLLIWVSGREFEWHILVAMLLIIGAAIVSNLKLPKKAKSAV